VIVTVVSCVLGAPVAGPSSDGSKGSRPLVVPW